MKAAPTLILLDTNIWLDNYLGYRPHAKESTTLIVECDKQGITLAYSATSIKDVFYCVGSELKRLILVEKSRITQQEATACNETAWACVQSMTNLGVAATIAEPQIALANHYKKLNTDFEDDLVLAAMECSKADYLVTNDENLLKKSPFPTLNSADMLAVLDACVV